MPKRSLAILASALSHTQDLAAYLQEHWAHRKRDDKRLSPGEVLGWVKGNDWPLEELQQIFQGPRGERQVKPSGYVRFRHWDLYSERGLARQRVAVWLSADVKTLTLEFTAEPLAQYTSTPEPDRKHLKEVTLLRLFETRFPSGQLLLWEQDAVDWRLALPRPTPARRRRRSLTEVMQLPLLHEVAI